MNPRTERLTVDGPAGALEVAIDRPAPRADAADPADHADLAAATEPAAAGWALLCHPHPLHGGTLDNKVVQTLARAVLAHGWTAVRFNVRGAGASAGHWDGGEGEVLDALAVHDAVRRRGLAAGPLQAVAGFSFGGFVAAEAARRLGAAGPPRLLLVAPAVVNFPVPAVPAPTQVLHGEADDVVPLTAVLDWARPQALPVTVLPGAGHFFHGLLPQLRQWAQDALDARTSSP